jgi:hypothetical protein
MPPQADLNYLKTFVANFAPLGAHQETRATGTWGAKKGKGWV